MSKPSRHRARSGANFGPRRRYRRQDSGEEIELRITEMGAQGDGVGEKDGRRFFVACALPGDVVRVKTAGRMRDGGVRANILDIVSPADNRVDPFCPLHGECGGCGLQHMADADYLAWKQGRVLEALSRRGFGDVPVSPMVSVPQASRRRAQLSYEVIGKRARIGFHGRGTHRLVRVPTCPLFVPALNDALDAFSRALVNVLAPGSDGRIMLTQTEGGLDVLIESVFEPDLSAREHLAAVAQELNLARLSWKTHDTEAEQIIQLHSPAVHLGDVAVELPAGAFLQASVEGEREIAKLVIAGMQDCARVADLYCGVGSFTFPLVQAKDKRFVLAVEADAQAIIALDRAAGRAGVGGRVKTEIRDLDHRPLDAKDLSGIEGVVFDPPRAGASTQAALLADAGSVSRVVGVSCNPATFARDARTLVDGGFRLENVTPVDQFPYSAHIELVGRFIRD